MGSADRPRCPYASTFRPTCKRRSCPACGPVWARAWYVLLRRNLELFSGVVMVTLTAPGEDVLPWDTARCSHRPETRCSGKRGCRAQDRAVRQWADDAGYRWKKLRERAMVSCRRAGYAPQLLARVWEPQKRGAPHLHLILAGGPLNRASVRAFTAALDQRVHPDTGVPLTDDDDDPGVTLREWYGFGVQWKVTGERTGAEAARYVASYLTGRNGKSSIRENIADPRLAAVGALLWVTPRLTGVTGLTMRTLRRVRHVLAWARGLCPPPRWRYREERDLVVRLCLWLYGADVDPPRWKPPPSLADQLLASCYPIAA